MKQIPFKTDPRYALKRTKEGQIYPSRHFQNNFSTETESTRGFTKQNMAALSAGIHVVHRSGGSKLIQKEIRAVYGRSITSPRSASETRKLTNERARIKNEKADAERLGMTVEELREFNSNRSKYNG